MVMEAGLSMTDRVPSTLGTLLSLGMIRAAREIKGSGSIDAAAFVFDGIKLWFDMERQVSPRSVRA
jgi:Na+-translocating ferredoxin:NAD+ oxidoreductase RnfE subunit